MKQSNEDTNMRTNLIRETVTTVYEYEPAEPARIHYAGLAVEGTVQDALPSAHELPVNTDLLLQSIAKEKELLRIERERLAMESAALDNNIDVLENQRAKFAANKKRSAAMRGNNYAKRKKGPAKRKKKSR